MSKPVEKVKFCALCGFPFDTEGNRAKFCTDACKMNAHRVKAGKMSKQHASDLAIKRRAAFSRACVFGPTVEPPRRPGKK